MVIRVGIVGTSEGNGHPFSFSAIINGYNEEKFEEAGWPVILDYLRKSPRGQDGITGAQVTHAWTQDPKVTAALCAASKIGNRCENLIDMLDEIDALIIARDDWEEHFKMAKPFLDRGIPVFIDKPLTLSEDEIEYFLPFIESGKLMSCSGFRFASELANFENIKKQIGNLKLISGVVINDLAKYGIHLLEAISCFNKTLTASVIVTRNFSDHESFSFKFDSGVRFNLECLGNVNKIFHLGLYGDKGKKCIELEDNFSAFKNTIEKFFQMVITGKPAIEPQETIQLMKIIMAAKNLHEGESIDLYFDRSKMMSGGG